MPQRKAGLLSFCLNELVHAHSSICLSLSAADKCCAISSRYSFILHYWSSNRIDSAAESKLSYNSSHKLDEHPSSPLAPREGVNRSPAACSTSLSVSDGASLPKQSFFGCCLSSTSSAFSSCCAMLYFEWTRDTKVVPLHFNLY